MDINTTALFGQQQAMSQLQVGQAMLKNNAKAEQKTATILAQAIEAAGSAGNAVRGQNLDISV
jgi:hypothetical protein